MLNLEIIAACFENRTIIGHQWPFTLLGYTDPISGQFVWAGWRAKWHWHNLLSGILFSPVSIIPTLLRTHSGITDVT